MLAWAAENKELAGAAMQSIAALLGVVVAAFAIVFTISTNRQARAQQILDERRAAALLIWAEVRTIQAGCREWIQKFSRRRRQDPRFVRADPGTPISVPLSSRMYESQLLRLAHFSPTTLEKIVFFYDALEVYRRCLAKPVQPDKAMTLPELHAELHEVLELELRAEDLAMAIFAEVESGATQPSRERQRELTMYEPIFDKEDDYLDFGLKEVNGAKDHERNVTLLRERREGSVAPDWRAQQQTQLADHEPTDG